MNELDIYELFKKILSRSKTIEGRFSVAVGYGNDLNTNNLGEIVKDALGGIVTNKKYPLALMMPPYEIVPDSTKGWSRFKVRLFFLTLQYSNNGIKSPNQFSNTSEYTILQDWKDMRQCAGDFRRYIDEYLICEHLLNKIRIPDNSTESYERFSNVGNDKLVAVMIAFDIEIFNPCELKDY
jgi:hypothetical protein